MTRYCFPHLRDCLRKLSDSFEFPHFLCVRVIRVIEILPTPGCIFTDSLHSSSGSRIDRDVSPRRRNLEILNAIQISFRKPAADWLIAKSSLWISKATYADVLQTFDLCHCWNEI